MLWRRPARSKTERKASLPYWLPRSLWKMAPLAAGRTSKACLVVFGIVGLIFTSIVVRRLVNVTRLEVTPQRLSISHGPLPWRRSFEVAMDTIRAVEVRPFQWRYEGNVATHYHVWSVHEDGHEKCLLERDTTAEQANLVRDEIQRVLDARVPGKML